MCNHASYDKGVEKKSSTFVICAILYTNAQRITICNEEDVEAEEGEEVDDDQILKMKIMKMLQRTRVVIR